VPFGVVHKGPPQNNLQLRVLLVESSHLGGLFKCGAAQNEHNQSARPVQRAVVELVEEGAQSAPPHTQHTAHSTQHTAHSTQHTAHSTHTEDILVSRCGARHTGEVRLLELGLGSSLCVCVYASVRVCLCACECMCSHKGIHAQSVWK
jgi:hypothetical protein